MCFVVAMQTENHGRGLTHILNQHRTACIYVLFALFICCFVMVVVSWLPVTKAITNVSFVFSEIQPQTPKVDLGHTENYIPRVVHNLVDESSANKALHKTPYLEAWDHKTYNIVQRNEFVRKVYKAEWPDIVHAYNLCSLPELQSTFFKYLVVYHCGGLYLDCHSVVLRPLDDLLKSGKAVVATTSANEQRGIVFTYKPVTQNKFQSWWILAPKHDELLWHVIWQIVRNVYLLHTNGDQLRKLKSSSNLVSDVAGCGCFTHVTNKLINKALIVKNDFVAQSKDTLTQFKARFVHQPFHLVFVQCHKPKVLTKLPHQIPTIIHQTHETRWVTPGMANAMQRIRDHAPNCEYRYYDASEARAFIQHYYPEALDAYDALLPAAFQTDLFRAVVVYVHGGTYFDSGFTPLNNTHLFEHVLEHDDRLVFPIDVTCNGIYNGMFSSVPKHEYLKHIITHIIDNVANQKLFANEPWGSLKITGPLAHAHVLKQNLTFPLQEGRYAKGLRLLSHTHPGKSIGRIHFNNRVYYATRYETYDEDRELNSTGRPHYSILWEKGLVYKTKDT